MLNSHFYFYSNFKGFIVHALKDLLHLRFKSQYLFELHYFKNYFALHWIIHNALKLKIETLYLGIKILDEYLQVRFTTILIKLEFNIIFKIPKV